MRSICQSSARTSADPYFQNAQIHLGELQVYGDLAKRFCQPRSVIVDVGANIGLSDLVLAYSMPEATIHALEPVEATFRLLRENLAANARGRVTPRQIALSDAEGTVEFHESGDSSASHIIGPGHIVGEAFRNAPTKVRSTSFDAFVPEQGLQRIDFVKIDVEGFEIDVLNGMLETIHWFQPIVCMEFNSWTAIAFWSAPIEVVRPLVWLLSLEDGRDGKAPEA